MRHTDGSRAPTPVVLPEIRPAFRAFSRRELLLTSWSDRMKMDAGDQIMFASQRREIEMECANRGESIVFAAAAEAEAARMEQKGPRPLPRRRRGRGGMLPGH